MKKLNKAQSKQYLELRTKVEEAVLALNQARSEFETFREEIREEMQNHYDERSEKWQESDAAQSYDSWMSAWDEEIVEEVNEDLPEYPEEPEG